MTLFRKASSSRKGRPSESLETLHWLYLVEQRSVIPIKWLVLFLVITLLLLDDPSRESILQPPFLAVLAGYTLSNLLFTLLFLARWLPVRRFRAASYSSLIFDLAFVSGLIYLTGGLSSDFYFLFLLLILRSAALFQDARKKFVCDLFMTFVFLACAFLNTDTPLLGAEHREGESNPVAYLFFRLTLIWGVILMSWFLVQVLTSQQARIFTINERLRFQSEQNRQVLSSMTDAVLVFDQSLQLRLCNPSAERLLAELKGEPLRGKPGLSDQDHDETLESPPRLVGLRSRAKGNEKARRVSFWWRMTPDQIADPLERLLEEVRFRPDLRISGQPINLLGQGGKSFSLIATAGVLGEETEARLGWVVLLRDISEFRSLENQLLKSEKLAAVGRLAAGLAHELGNPLGIIKSCANYLMKKSGRDSDLSEETGVLASEAERCQRILRQLLDFASQEQLHLAEFDLKDILERAVNLVAFQAPDTVEIRFSSDVEAAPGYTDENLLTQAFVNLLLNGAQSITDEGEVELRLSLIEGSGYWATVRDTGCGMGKESLKRLFEPFYTTKKDGTGLGLAITQRIIERLGGEIAVESEPGKGTTFSIFLPIRVEEVAAGIRL